MPGKMWDHRGRDPDNPMPTSRFDALYTDSAMQRFASSTARRYGKNDEDVEDRAAVGWEAVWIASGGTSVDGIRKTMAARIEAYYRTTELPERRLDGDPEGTFDQDHYFYGADRK